MDLPVIQRAMNAVKVDVPEGFNEEGYFLYVGADGVIVAGGSAAGTFYGLQTLKQLVRGDGADAFVRGVYISDWPAMR